MMAVFTLVFSVMMPNKQVQNYPVFVLAALLPWNWLASSIGGSISSVVTNAHLIKKVYFPREILPASVVISNLVNFLLASIVLFVVLIVTGVQLTSAVLMFPLLIIIQAVFLLGLALFLSALNVFFRDTEVIMDVGILAWFFATPIFYDIKELFPQYERWLYIINPMASLIEAYRNVLVRGVLPSSDFLLRTLVTCLVVLVIGYAFFMRKSRMFGEEL
jgi:ABC-type polysaccharide/polyol phosphate export permease